MMYFRYLGTGSAFSAENFQSNAVLEIDGKRLLIDAGGTVHMAMKKGDVDLRSLDGVYVSHLHADHWGGAEYLAYGTHFHPGFVVNGERRRLKVFAHPDVREGLWHNLHATVLPNKKSEMQDFFDVQGHNGATFEWQGVQFEMTRADHCLDNNRPMPCYGLRWSTGGHSARSVWFSGDSKVDWNSLNFDVDVIFHDCETGPVKTGVHARYEDLLGLPAKVRRKMRLYHFSDGWKPDAVSDGFNGWAQQGATIEL